MSCGGATYDADTGVAHAGSKVTGDLDEGTRR